MTFAVVNIAAIVIGVMLMMLACVLMEKVDPESKRSWLVFGVLVFLIGFFWCVGRGAMMLVCWLFDWPVIPL